MSEKSDIAVENFKTGMNCAQAVLTAFAKEFHLHEELAMRIAAGFGGGCKSGELCGAVAGGVMVIGVAQGNTETDDAQQKAICAGLTKQLMSDFSERHSCLRCADLLKSANESGEYEAPLHDNYCPLLVAEVVLELERMLGD